MAGLFGLFDYTKEGPGIDPDEPQKGAIGEFFSILGTKFWRIVQINLLMLFFAIPALILSFVLTNWLFPQIMPQFDYQNILDVLASVGFEEALAEGIKLEAVASHLFVSTVFIVTAAVVALQLIVIGPAQAGFTYLFRNMARREPTFTWMDFADTAKKNFKQSLLYSLVTILISVIMGIAMYYYSRVMPPSIFKTILQSFIGIAAIFFLMMQFYAYQLMITFDLSMKNIYRNAFLLTFLKLPSNFFILVLQVVLLIVIPIFVVWGFPNGITSLIILVLYVFFLFGFSLYLSNYQANRQIQRYMMPPHDDEDGGYAEEVEDFTDEVIDSEEELVHDPKSEPSVI